MRIDHPWVAKIACAGILTVIAAGTAIIWSNASDKSRRLRMVPAALGVREVVYAREETYGFGPGGNVTGLVVFELPATIANGIERQGVTYLTQYVPTHAVMQRHGWTQIPFRWTPTPVLVEASSLDVDSKLSHDIGKYLGTYGFEIPIDDAFKKTINHALSSKGSFVDDDGHRLIIVIPGAKKFVFAYRN